MKKIIGKIQQENMIVSFVCENHHFTFFRVDNNAVTGLYVTLFAKKRIILKCFGFR